jgi:uncharacterized protein YdeI (YjbR/CyaY-like superfamily)
MRDFDEIMIRMGEEGLPQLLVEAFDGELQLLEWALALSPSIRKEIGQWVTQPKSEAGRVRRAEHLAERFLSTMEAERELPGFLVRALNEAGAMKGWKSMTALQRRMLLLAVFRPKGMEGRERQVARMVEAAVLRDRKPREER